MTILVEQHYDVEADDCTVLFVTASADEILIWVRTLKLLALLSAIEHLGLRTRPKSSE